MATVVSGIWRRNAAAIRRGIPATQSVCVAIAAAAANLGAEVAISQTRPCDAKNSSMPNTRTAEREQNIDVPERVELLLRHPSANLRVTLTLDEHRLRYVVHSQSVVHTRRLPLAPACC